MGPRRRTLATVAALGMLVTGCTSTTSGDASPTPFPTAAPTDVSPHSVTGSTSSSSASSAPTRSPSAAGAAKPTSSSTPSHRPNGDPLPLPFHTGDARQVITAVASSTSSTAGVVQAWRRVGGGWRKVGPSVPAWFGSDGLTRHPSETRSATPIGSFTLTHAFGRLADPGTALPYVRTTPADWWISQPGPLYNTRQRCSSRCAFTQGDPNEHLYNTVPYYRFAVVIDYNTRNSPGGVVQGAGSAFFLHVTVGEPTQGCISIAQAQLVRLVRWLAPARHPRILIGA